MTTSTTSTPGRSSPPTNSPPQSLSSPVVRWFLDGWITTKRNMIKIKRVPDILVFTTLQPIMFVLLFT